MRIFFLLSIVLALLVGWIVAAPPRPADTTQSPTARSTAPPPAVAREGGWPGTIEVRRNADGHFMAGGRVNGTPFNFVVDTGSSGVALSRADAGRAGVHVTDAEFDGEARTAAGKIRVAHVRLARVRVGTIELPDVPGLILDVDDALPLLGQSFLGRIDKVAIEGDRMTLTKL
jgi:aspartyl protease family protein